MKLRVLTVLALVMGLTGLTACRSASGGMPWREATAMVLGEGTAQTQTMEGEELEAYLRTFERDERTGFRLVHDTQTGYIVVGGTRYLVTAAKETAADGGDLLTIHSGSQPLHLKQR